MSDLVKRLRELAQAKHDDLSIGDEAADRIAELETALQKIADRTRNAHLLSYAGHMEMHEVSRFINSALAGGKDE